MPQYANGSRKTEYRTWTPLRERCHPLCKDSLEKKLILKQATKAQAFKASWSSLSPAGEGDNHILFLRLVLRYCLIAIDCFSYSSLGGLRHSAGDDLGATYRFTLPQTGSSDLGVCFIEVQESYRYKRYIDNTKRKIDRFNSIRSKVIRSLKTIRP